MRLHIIFMTSYYNRPSEPGLLRSWQVANFLVDRGHRVTVITSDAHYMTARRKGAFPWRRERERDGLEVLWLYAPPEYRKSLKRRFLYSVTLGILALVAGVVGDRPDIVLAAAPPPTLPVAGLVVSRLRRCLFVEEVRDLQTDDAIALGILPQNCFSRMLLSVENWTHHKADGVVAVTPGIRRILHDKGVSAEKVVVIPNGYEELLFNLPGPTREDLGWQGRFVVLYCGGLGLTYDITTLLHTAMLLRDEEDVLFVIVGDGERRQEYERFAREHNLRVQFLGARPRSQVPGLCRCANVGVSLFPKGDLWSHVLGNKTFDYLGSGIPMVFAGRGDTADLLNESGSGLTVAPEDAEALKEAILFLKANQDVAKEMGRRGRTFVQERYSRRKLLIDLERYLIALYESREAKAVGAYSNHASGP